jgi:hypothetical protein
MLGEERGKSNSVQDALDLPQESLSEGFAAPTDSDEFNVDDELERDPELPVKDFFGNDVDVSLRLFEP